MGPREHGKSHKDGLMVSRETRTGVQQLAQARDRLLDTFRRHSSDPDIDAKIARFLLDGTGRPDMPLPVIEAQDRLLEKLHGFESQKKVGPE